MAILEKIVIDEVLWQQLRVTAENWGRPMDDVVSMLLTNALQKNDHAEAALMDELRKGREELAHIVLSDTDINTAKAQGRR